MTPTINWTEELVDQIRQCAAEGMTVPEILKELKLHCSANTIRNVMNRFHIQATTYQPSRSHPWRFGKF